MRWGQIRYDGMRWCRWESWWVCCSSTAFWCLVKLVDDADAFCSFTAVPSYFIIEQSLLITTLTHASILCLYSRTQSSFLLPKAMFIFHCLFFISPNIERTQSFPSLPLYNSKLGSFVVYVRLSPVQLLHYKLQFVRTTSFWPSINFFLLEGDVCFSPSTVSCKHLFSTQRPTVTNVVVKMASNVVLQGKY